AAGTIRLMVLLRTQGRVERLHVSAAARDVDCRKATGAGCQSAGDHCEGLTRLFHHFAGIIHHAPAPRILRRGQNGADVHRPAPCSWSAALAWSRVRLGSEKQLRTATPSSGNTVHDVRIERWTIPAAQTRKW